MKVSPFSLSLLGALCLFTLPPAVQAAPSAPIGDAPPVIPAPRSLDFTPGRPGFALGKKLPLHLADSSPETQKAAQTLEKALKNGGLDTSRKTSVKDALRLTLAPELGKEGYELEITPDGINLSVGSPAGAFCAAQTLLQSLSLLPEGKTALPSLKIKDAPRFKWRGLMIDSGRNPRTLEELKKIVNLMSFYKFNTLHWHLTDDQGWRIEIKKYPKLTEIGSIRAGTPTLGNRNKCDDKPFGFFHTQKEIKELVDYARERNITIVPEIEVPGHACAAIAAYPEYGNKDIKNYQPAVSTQWGVLPYLFSPTEETFQFLDDVMTEVAALFPDSPYIHVGGDEAPKGQWQQSATAQKIMKENGLKNEHELQSYFIRRVEKIVNSKGKKLIGWDEIQEGGLSKTATMMVWRSWDWAKHALENGNEIIMTPNSHCYLDYIQGKRPEGPEYDQIGGNLPLEKVYNLNPVPEGTTPEQEKRIVGVQGNCWSEYLHTLDKWEYVIFPRALAIAEAGWTPQERKNEQDFLARWQKHQPLLDAKKVNYRKDDGSTAKKNPVLSQKDA